MLEEINIRNLGVIEEAVLEFTPGLNVITGETGAGKTMVLTGLGLLLGRKGAASIVRKGATETTVEGCWDVTGNPSLADIEETGATIDDNQLFINRTVTKEGKSKLVVGGKRTPASVVDSFGHTLVNIHGQSDQIRLKSPVAQRTALDKYAASTVNPLKAEYQDTYNQWKTLTAQIAEVQKNTATMLREYEYYKHVVEEFEKVNPAPNEDTELKQEANTLTHVETIREGLTEAYTRISNPEGYEMEDASTTLNLISSALNGIREYDPKLEEFADIADRLLAELTDLNMEVSTYLSSVDGLALERLAEVNERLTLLNPLLKKHGPTMEEALAVWEEASRKVVELNPETNNLEALTAQQTEVHKVMSKQATALTKARQKAAGQLTEAVNKELAGLAMSGSQLVIQVTPTDSYTVQGADNVLFLMKTPATPEPVPLGKGASGGELSRIMLSLELCLADPKTTATYLFDEVDSGVGGETALEIAKRLALLAKTTQVVVVSHLAQVAAFADNHLQVAKMLEGDTVTTTVSKLNENQRVKELSRMISGLTDSETGKAHAEELLEEASRFKTA